MADGNDIVPPLLTNSPGGTGSGQSHFF